MFGFQISAQIGDVILFEPLGAFVPDSDKAPAAEADA
jgi:hypothetical protein